MQALESVAYCHAPRLEAAQTVHKMFPLRGEILKKLENRIIVIHWSFL